MVAAAEGHWATSGDMVDAIEELAIEAMVLAAEADGSLDDLEDGLFRFGRVIAGQPDLRAALADPSLPADGKQGLLNTLLDGKVTPVTLRLISQVVLHPRGRPLVAGLDLAAAIAARRREQLDRGGAFGGRAVRDSAQAARRSPRGLIRAPNSPECRD